MIQEHQRIRIVSRDPSPCINCAERFTACSDHCPKDERGEYGHKAWKARIDLVKNQRKNYMDTRQDDLKRRELWSIRK